MSKNIEIKGNYIYITDSDTNVVFDRSAALVEFRKKTDTSELFTVWYKGYSVGIDNCIWSDFELDGVPFASQVAFEDWKNANTASLCSGGGGSTPVISSKVAAITSVDWVLGGEGSGSTHYFVYTHGLQTKDLIFEARDTDGDFVRVLNDYYTTGVGITDGSNQVRIETSDNSLNVAVLISNGGNSSVINTLNVDDTIIADDSPLAVGGKLIKVIGTADIDITIDTGVLTAGQTCVFANKTAFAMNFIIGTQDVKASASNSFVGFGQYSLVTFVHDGTDIILSGDTA